MNRNIFLIIFFVLNCSLINAQQPTSTHQKELDYYNAKGLTAEDYQHINQNSLKPHNKSLKSCTLNKIVFGWHPYWSNGLEVNYDWNLLSDLSYFAYEVNPSTGNASNTHSWSTVAVVDSALAHGVKVNLCVTLFSSHATFFGSSSAQQTLISNLINAVQQRNAHGVNIDFEAVPSANKNDLTNFMINLCNQMHTAIPNSKISMALPAVDWSGTYDVVAMMNYVDLFLIMGYDYYYNGSTQAGPTDPLYTHVSSYNYNLSKSVTYYLNKGVPHAKLGLGLPYFGKEWVTTSTSIPANTDSTGVSRTYKYIRDNNSGNYTNPVNYYKSMSTYYVFYYSNKWRQCFITDAPMMEKRFDFVNRRGLAGIAIWALGYDDGYNDMWQAIENKFTNCATIPCHDTIYDMGGPDGNYFNNEDYSYTINPSGASGLNMSFISFNTTAGSDTLKIYDGNSTNAPLIGNYTGNNTPGSITATGTALTLSFKSGAATTSSGWKAYYMCTLDTIPPSTTIINPGNWVNTDFVVQCVDADNVNGSGLNKRFYQVSDFDGNRWGGNYERGFMFDDFSIINNQLWTVAPNGGTWNSNNSILHQSDETNSNTNIYAPLVQTLSNRYMYQFLAKIDGTDNNKRFGFHFFCDSASYSNRNNSYFVWFRQSTHVVEFYKVTNDVFTMIKSIPNIITNTNQWYDIKITYDRISGEIHLYRDNIFIGSHTDSSPYTTNGNYISFRSGNCQLFVDSINVYRTRTSTPIVTVGNAVNKDIRFESPDMQTATGKIKSVVTDTANNLSLINYSDFFVDYSAPEEINNVEDGLGSDVDTIFSSNTLSANWSASSDTNTGIIAYWYAVGTSPGDTNILSWTNNGNNLSVTHTGLNLLHDTIYYVSVKAENGAGFFSNISSSNGQKAIITAAVMALFTWNTDTICTGDSVIFTNQSLNANSYSWSFQGGNPSDTTIANPVVVYNTPGIYHVQLIAYGNSTSDTLSINALIYVSQNTVASFNCPDTVFLPNAFVVFNNTSTNCLTYYWDFGDGNNSTDYNPWHQYQNEGVYQVTLFTTHTSCFDSFSKPIHVLLNNSIKDGFLNSGLSVYPNPFTDILFIELLNKNSYKLQIQIFDMCGKSLFMDNIQVQNEEKFVYKFDDVLKSFSQGVYILNINTDKDNINYRIIKM